MRITTNKQGFAAHMKLEGAVVVGYDKDAGTITFETEKNEKQWRVGYANSRDSRYNAELIEIRNLMKGNK